MKRGVTSRGLLTLSMSVVMTILLLLCIGSANMVEASSGDGEVVYDPEMQVYLNPGSPVYDAGAGYIAVRYLTEGAHTANADRMSYLILSVPYSANTIDEDQILYYGKMFIHTGLGEEVDFSHGGTASFKFPQELDRSGWSKSYYVYIILEHVNGTNEVDYASRPYRIEAPGEPAICIPPSSVTVLNGNHVSFYIGTFGDSLKYQWQSRKDSSSAWANSERTGAKTSYLSFNPTGGLNNWQFRCVVTTDSGKQLISDTAVLTVLPKILDEPRSQDVRAFSTASYSVNAEGKAPLSYQWQSRKDSSSAWVNSGQNGAKSSELLVNAKYGLNGWQFRCIVTDADGNQSITETATLGVTLGIERKEEWYQEAPIGGTATFTVNANGKQPLRYQWQSRNPRTREWINSGQSGARTDTLSVAVKAGLNNYRFRCIVTDADGNTCISEEMCLAIAPKITKQPENVSVPVGSVARFSVEVMGSDRLIYQWQSRKDSSSAWTNSGQPGAGTATLSVNTNAGLNGWRFRCIVMDYYGEEEAFSKEVILTVLPKITAQPKNTSVTAGSTAKFTIGVTGKAPFTYQWQSRKNSSASWVNSGQSGAKTATLSVATNTGLNGYQFRCIITDAFGQKVTSETVTLTILPKITKQPEKQTIAAGSTATFSIRATGAGLTYQWQSRKDANSAWASSGQPGAKTNTLSVAVKAGINGWQFRCVVQDSNGKMLISDPATLTATKGKSALKVLIINFDPVINVNGKSVKQHALMEDWSDPYELAEQFAAKMEEVSYGNVRYEIVDTIELNEFPMSKDGRSYTASEYYTTLMKANKETNGLYWEYSGWKEFRDEEGSAFTFDYAKYFEKYNIFRRVNSGEIDEVWFFRGPMIGLELFESMMVGEDAFFINGDEMVVPGCKNFAVYGFNYERGLGEMLEDAGHRMERTMDTIFGDPNYNKDYSKYTEWEKFTAYDLVAPGHAGVGNVHFAPNSVEDYDWDNYTPVQSSCDTWYNYPNLSGSTKTVSCSDWGYGDTAAHHIWWFKHIPHFDGVNSKTGKYNNWWNYFLFEHL